ncbi:MAG TPA: recombinase RecT, partial [Thermoleophilia bacterium]|nr:recombinase RecT [Thermoleophilia bacterium]
IGQSGRTGSAHALVERYVKVALSALRRDVDEDGRPGKLQKCDVHSVIQAVTEACELGLEPGGILGYAYLIPYKNRKRNVYECKLMPSYKGKADLARRNGWELEAEAVYERDEFEYQLGDEPRIHHVPSMDVEPGPLTHVYAIARHASGAKKRAVMSVQQIERVRWAHSSMPESPAWVKDYDEMAKTKVIQRLEKLLPLSPQQDRAIEIERTNDPSPVVQGKIVDIPSRKTASDQRGEDPTPSTALPFPEPDPPESEIASGPDKRGVPETVEKKGSPALRRAREKVEADTVQLDLIIIETEPGGPCGISFSVNDEKFECEKPAGHDGRHMILSP